MLDAEDVKKKLKLEEEMSNNSMRQYIYIYGRKAKSELTKWKFIDNKIDIVEFTYDNQ